ncbi:MAG: putative lipid II flippase FtsW [Spirochaetes bacterium]|nr:putative lipid II flippase FtsW [Spirochaetota bacterium]
MGNNNDFSANNNIKEERSLKEVDRNLHSDVIARVRKKGEIDYVLLSVVIVLYGIGIIMVFSAGINEGMKYGQYYYFLKRQAIWLSVSFLTLIFFIFIDYTALERMRKPLIWITIILLALLLVPRFGRMGLVHPSRRWFRFGSVGFQPSEFAKIVLIVYLSSILSKKGERINDFYRGFLPPFLIISIIAFLIFLEPDFSTAFMLFFISIMMFFIAGISTVSIVSLSIVSIPALFLMINEKLYRKDRIAGFLNPWSDPTDKGYQIIQSFKAFAMGGVAGVGLGRSVQKMSHLPIPHTDFIYAVCAEEMGYVGAFMILFLYMIFAYRGYRIAFQQSDRFAFFLAFGITSLIVWGAIFNIAVVTGLLPATGVSLPFLSYGGSSLLANSILAGLLISISKNSSSRELETENLVWEQ